MKYRSRSLGQGTCQISTSRRSTMQGMVVVGLIIEELSNINVKCIQYRSRSMGQGTCQVSTMRWSTMQGLVVVSHIWGDIEHKLKICQRHWSAKYRSRSPGQGTCQVSTSRRSIIQGLVAEGLIVEDIWKGDVKGVKVKVTESSYLQSSYIEERLYARFGGCRPYSWGDIEHQHRMCKRHWSALERKI